LVRLNHLYTTLRSSRFVTRLGYWINALSRILTYLKTGAFLKLSSDPTDLFFEILDMAETGIQLLEGILQDVVILSMFHALHPEINRRWRPVMNVLWLICMLINGVLMLRNYNNTVSVLEVAQLRKRSKKEKKKTSSKNAVPSRPKSNSSHSEVSSTTQQPTEEKHTDAKSSSLEPPLDLTMLQVPTVGVKSNASTPLTTPSASPMSRLVEVQTHNNDRRLGVIDPEYATPSDRETIVTKLITNARQVVKDQLPKLLMNFTKYFADLAYCWCDTMQVFGRDSTSIQWTKASGALLSAIISINIRWTKMFALNR